MLAALITNIQVKQAMGESNNSAPQKPLAYLHIRSGNSPDYTKEKGLTQTQGKSQAWITNKNLLHLQLPSACNLANTRGGERLLAVTSIGEKKQ